MKRFLAIALAASLGLVMAGTVSAGTYEQGSTNASGVGAYTAGMAANGIGSSRHNLGGFGAHVVTPDTTEICVFCHTPHHTNTSMAPIWNRNIDSTNFKTYGTTIGGSDINTVEAPSLACLSCHDGVTTFDNLVNRPGKDVKGSSIAGQWKFYEDGNDYVTAVIGYPGLAGSVNAYSLQHSGRLDIGGGGPKTLNGTSGDDRTTVGLSDDHPVGVKYMGSDSSNPRASLRASTTTIANINLSADLADSAAAAGLGVGDNLWAVAGFISSTAKISDLLRGANGNVECSSCHDPHFNNKSWTEIVGTYAKAGLDETFENNGLFLRRVGGNSASGLCRTCHEK